DRSVERLDIRLEAAKQFRRTSSGEDSTVSDRAERRGGDAPRADACCLAVHDQIDMAEACKRPCRFDREPRLFPELLGDALVYRPAASTSVRERRQERVHDRLRAACDRCDVRPHWGRT